MKVFKYIIICLFLIFTIKIVVSGLGAISIIYTGLFYFFIYHLILFIYRFFSKSIPINHVIFITTLIISLFTVELALRFVLKKNLTYAEQNGSLSYASFYTHSNFFNKRNRKRKLGDMSELLVGQPNSTRKEIKNEFTYIHNYNSLGLRNEEIELDKPNNEFRVIALGDSFTEGIGTPEDSTWVKQLQTILQQQTKSQIVNCINAGHSGSDPVFEYQLLEKKLLPYKPDLVLIALNGSDPRDIFIRGGHERYDTNGMLTLQIGPWWEYFYGTSFIFRFFIRDIMKYNDYLVKDKGFELQLQESFDVIYEVIIKFIELSQKHDFQFKVVFMPLSNELYTQGMQLDPIVNYLLEKGMQKNVIYLPNCYNRYISYFKKQPDFYYWKIDSHHNSKGYKMMAECIAENLLNQN